MRIVFWILCEIPHTFFIRFEVSKYNQWIIVDDKLFSVRHAMCRKFRYGSNHEISRLIAVLLITKTDITRKKNEWGEYSQLLSRDSLHYSNRDAYNGADHSDSRAESAVDGHTITNLRMEWYYTLPIFVRIRFPAQISIYIYIAWSVSSIVVPNL